MYEVSISEYMYTQRHTRHRANTHTHIYKTFSPYCIKTVSNNKIYVKVFIWKLEWGPAHI